MTESFKAGGPGWTDRHLDAYLRTGGKIGHLVDFGPEGNAQTACLVLQTRGEEGATAMVPLIYGKDKADFVVVAEAGESGLPSWFERIRADARVAFQVADAKYFGRAEIAEGPERARLFEMMARIYPPFGSAAARGLDLPVILLRAEGALDRFPG